MATDDDKQMPEPDPWAGLDIGGAEDKAEDFTFSFEGVEDAPAAHDEPVAENAGDPSDVAAEDVPLAVFPPPDAESPGSDVVIGTGRSGIIALPNAADDAGDGEMDARDEADPFFDDKDIARELGIADGDVDAVAAGSTGDRDEQEHAADFGEPIAEAHSDDVSFDAGMMAAGGGFGDSEQAEPVADASESWQEDPSSIPLTAAVAAAGAVVADTQSGGRQPGGKKKAGGLGQMVGVVMGGLMALPITYAILIWGFQKDPFKLGRQMPEQMAFLLPQKLRPGYKPPKKPTGGPNLDAAPSLDDLPTADESASPSSAEPDATAAMEPTDSESADAEETAEPAEGGKGSESAPMKTESLAGTPAEPAGEGAEPSDEAADADADAKPTEEASADAVAAAPAMAADTKLAAVPKSDALPGLDALMADADAAVVAPAPAAPPPLDLTDVDAAAERATQALESLEALDSTADPGSPERDRLLVAWYKRIADLGEELVRLETIAADSGRPLQAIPASAADLLDRVCANDAAVADLDRLGGMWLTSQKRRADGIAMVVTLGVSRQVGPYWSTRASVSGAQADGSDRGMAIISRSAPPADAGERVVVSGVMFDGDAVWAADMRPVAPQPSLDGEQE